jgi:hypothetical protein
MTGTRYCKFGLSDTKHTSNIQLVTAITVFFFDSRFIILYIHYFTVVPAIFQSTGSGIPMN